MGDKDTTPKQGEKGTNQQEKRPLRRRRNPSSSSSSSESSSSSSSSSSSLSYYISTSSSSSRGTATKQRRLQDVSRKEEAMAIRQKFPTKVPIIVERYHRDNRLPILDKIKFLVPEDITMSQFLVIIRSRMRIRPNQSLYLIIDNRSMLSMTLTMAQAYDHYGDADGFLYITYASEEMFGYQDDIGGAQEVEAIRHRFPNKVPLYLQRYEREREVPIIGRNKFLVPQELTMSQFLFVIRKKMKLRETQALYLLVNDKVMVTHTTTMAQAYEQFRAEDGYLHITYAAQQAFG